MRNIDAQEVTKAVSRLCQEASFFLPDDVLNVLKQMRQSEESPLGQQTLDQILENAKLAREEEMAICQDCGVAVIFLEVGQDAHITGGDLYEAVHEGVRSNRGIGARCQDG